VVGFKPEGTVLLEHHGMRISASNRRIFRVDGVHPGGPGDEYTLGVKRREGVEHAPKPDSESGTPDPDSEEDEPPGMAEDSDSEGEEPRVAQGPHHELTCGRFHHAGPKHDTEAHPPSPSTVPVQPPVHLPVQPPGVPTGMHKVPVGDGGRSQRAHDVQPPSAQIISDKSPAITYEVGALEEAEEWAEKDHPDYRLMEVFFQWLLRVFGPFDVEAYSDVAGDNLHLEILLA
jgi:hypothetical protein